MVTVVNNKIISQYRPINRNIKKILDTSIANNDILVKIMGRNIKENEFNAFFQYFL